MLKNNLLPEPVEAFKIQQYLPHRYPFLLIDRVLEMEVEPEKRLIGVKNISVNEPFFQGHFPNNPVMPGVLMIEAMAQAAGMLAHLAAEVDGKTGELYYLVKVDNARFSQIVVPGDQLILDTIQKRIMRRMGHYVCQAFVGEKRVASCELLCAGKQA
jgi:3-hydroxyacyl-[acyl-carrier-protein] dehydratase